MADLEHDVPNTPDTIFEAGSVSKQFTAAAVALLAAGCGSQSDSGRLDVVASVYPLYVAKLERNHT